MKGELPSPKGNGLLLPLNNCIHGRIINYLRKSNYNTKPPIIDIYVNGFIFLFFIYDLIGCIQFIVFNLKLSGSCTI